MVDVSRAIPEQFGDIGPGTIAYPKPYDLWRKPVQKATLAKVVIFCRDDVPVDASLIPHRVITGGLQTEIAHMGRLRKHIRERANECWRQILVKQQPNALQFYLSSGGWIGNEPSFAVCSEGVDCKEILAFEIRKIGENLCLRHAGREIRQHIVDRDPETSDTRLSTAFAGLDRDAVDGAHGMESTFGATTGQGWTVPADRAKTLGCYGTRKSAGRLRIVSLTPQLSCKGTYKNAREASIINSSFDSFSVR